MSRAVRGRQGAGASPDGRRGGFTLVELLVVVLIVGILAQVAIPNYRNVTTRARAVDVMSEIRVLEHALEEYVADGYQYPPDAAAGEMPTGLSQYLSEGFAFGGRNYLLDYQKLSIPGGLPGKPNLTELVGVAVVTDDEVLANALLDVFGNQRWYVVGNSYMFILSS